MVYTLPSGLASFETTGGTLPTEEWHIPGRAADRNKALREALKECHRLQSELERVRHAALELHGVIQEFKSLPSKCLERAMFDTADRYEARIKAGLQS
jgi:hypothetical protein